MSRRRTRPAALALAVGTLLAPAAVVVTAAPAHAFDCSYVQYQYNRAVAECGASAYRAIAYCRPTSGKSTAVYGNTVNRRYPGSIATCPAGTTVTNSGVQFLKPLG